MLVNLNPSNELNINSRALRQPKHKLMCSVLALLIIFKLEMLIFETQALTSQCEIDVIRKGVVFTYHLRYH